MVKRLVDLKAANLVDRTVTVLTRSPTAMRQIHYLLELERSGEQMEKNQQANLIKALDVVAIRDLAGRTRYRDVSGMMAKLVKDVGVDQASDPKPPAKVIKAWTVEDLLPWMDEAKLKAGDVPRGRAVFRQARCHQCHRIDGTGGVLGPNLTGLGGRYRARDVLESIIDPDKIIPDQFRTTIFFKKDGTQFTGQIVNLSKGVIQIRLDPSKPFPRVSFQKKDIAEIRPSKTSLMPKGLVNHLTPEQIRDLVVYLIKRN